MLQQTQMQATNSTTSAVLPSIDEIAANQQPLNSREVDELLEVLKKETHKRKLTQHHVKVAYTLFVALFVLMFLFFIYKGIKTGKWSDLSTLSTFSGMSACYTAVAFSKAHKKAAKQLAQYNDLRAVGPLTEVMEAQDRSLREEAKRALIQLLPQMKASDTEMLSAEQRQMLYHILSRRAARRKDLDLALAILQALEQIGDSKALPYVERLANAQFTGSEGQKVAETAREILPSLKARAAAERDLLGLLRPAYEVNAPAELLRPASGTEIADHLELLRAYMGSENQPSEHEVELAIKILDDLARRGNAEVLPYVEQIIHTPWVDPRLKASAESCRIALTGLNM